MTYGHIDIYYFPRGYLRGLGQRCLRHARYRGRLKSSRGLLLQAGPRRNEKELNNLG